MDNAVWPKGKKDDINTAFAFLFDVRAKVGDEIKISIAASKVYKMFVLDKLVGYGPARTAHGHARIDEYTFIAQEETTPITFEVVAYRVNSYAYVNEEPFFDCDIFINGKKQLTSLDSLCFELTDRVVKVQRYSFQRPFIEVYKMGYCRKNLYSRRKNVFPRVETELAKHGIYHARGVKYPELIQAVSCKEIEYGATIIDKNKPTYQDRSLNEIGETLLGFKYEELADRVSDTVSSFVYQPSESGENPYILYDAGREYSGLLNVEIRVDRPCELYLIFDEILWEEGKDIYSNGEKNLSFSRLNCCNVIKYSLEEGKYSLQSFEPYSLRYVKAICLGGKAELSKISITPIENPAHSTFVGKIADAESDAILDAAFQTYKQNTLDLLMDCPSRERAGWLNDSYFAREADLLFSGNALTEKNFLENILWAPDLSEIPKGMLPMCYPSDHIDGQFIPQCTMWTIIELCERIRRFPQEELKDLAKEKIYNAIKYFQAFENEDGLLENLQGWIFLEHSICNSQEYVQGVNYPSNMIYCGMLNAVGEIFQDSYLKQKVDSIKTTIRVQSFNGELFEDNRVREDGKLILKEHLSETCQYYAFFFGIADSENYPELYKKLFLQERAEFLKRYPKIPASNVIVGLLLRSQILKREGMQKVLLRESKDIYSKMARRTGTLWENNGIYASCNHGLAAIAAVWFVYLYSGYCGVEKGEAIFDSNFIGDDCEFKFFYDGVAISIEVKNGKRKIYTKLPVKIKENK